MHLVPFPCSRRAGLRTRPRAGGNGSPWLKPGIPVGIQLTIAACLRGRQRVDWVLAPASQPRQKLATWARERWAQFTGVTVKNRHGHVPARLLAELSRHRADIMKRQREPAVAHLGDAVNAGRAAPRALSLIRAYVDGPGHWCYIERYTLAERVGDFLCEGRGKLEDRRVSRRCADH
jgi:hypothetical protein